jgi:hypothetical protein
MKVIKTLIFLFLITLLNNNLFSNEEYIFKNETNLTKKNIVSGYNLNSDVNTSKYAPFIQASYILYQPIQKAMSFVFFDRQDTNFQDKVKDVDFSLQSGFKVDFGLTFKDYDHYNFLASYLFLRSTTDDLANSDASSTILKLKPLWHSNDVNVNASSILAKWELDLDLLDFKTTRSYYIGRFLTFEPKFGIKTGRIYQKFLERVYVLNSIISFEDKSKSNSWIIGPSVSANAKWFLNKYFSINTDIEGSIFYQNYKIRHQEENAITPTTLDINIINNSYDFNSSLKFSFSFEAGKYINNDDQFILIKIGYDSLVFFNQNYMRHLKDLYKSYDSKNIGDLYLHGLNMSLSFNF